ncbi:MAG: hypothetical protein DCF16_06325 [Alphaproteobacteria bacterium]|nr:MAG: hypothetical protein DCF16_06325 [Alphaproteobacteria bacterium]
MSLPQDHRKAPLELWRAAGALLRTLFNLFGAPEELAARHTITGPTYRLILNWLHCAEALMRHLLFIEASAHPRGAASSAKRAHAQRQSREMSFEADKPEEWRVSFRLCADDRRLPAGKRLSTLTAPRRPQSLAPTTFHSAWPLAERFEALLRVHNDPAPFARRLARRLHAAPRIIATLLNAPAQLAPRIGEEIFATLRVFCGQTKPVFDSS